MPGNRRGIRRAGRILVPVLFVILMLAAASLFYSAPPALSQSSYSYDSFHTELTINTDGTLRVRNKATYVISDASVKVGLFIPSSYGKVMEARVLGGDEAPLPDGKWGYEQGSDGYTLWFEAGGGTPLATCIYEYLLDGALHVNGDLMGFDAWAAVPENRSSTIKETSVTLCFPPGADPAAISIAATPGNYSGQITKRFVGSDTAVVEASFLDVNSSYSIECYWPASLMDQASLTPSDPGEKSWDFERFDTEITINSDSSYTVRETQVVNFRGEFTFLNRDLSTQPAYDFDGRTYGRVRIHDIAVFDLEGNPYDDSLWSVEGYDGGKTVHIEFSARDEQRGWIIEYRMTGAIIFAKDYDRLYWDAVSLDRNVPIRSSTITVKLPPGTDFEASDATHYVDISNPPSSYESGKEEGAFWWLITDIPAYTTFTVDVVFPKGAVTVPWQYGRPCGIVVIAASSVLLAVALAGMMLLWWKRGRDVGRTGTTMVRYDPPEGLTPAMVGMLVNQKPRVEDISATIVDLARRGYLSIIEEERRSLIRIKKFSFQRTSSDYSGLLPYEREIMDGLFATGDRVDESDLKNSFYTHIDAILNKGVKKDVLELGIFTRDPSALRARYMTAGILVAALPVAAFFFLPTWFDLGWLALLLLTFIPIGAIVAVVGQAMPSRSAKGSRAYEHAMGFKEYMATAEKQEMEFMTPENFQANLPYAMVLDVADTWAGKFQDIYTTPPQWYSGSGTAFSTAYLASSLNDMTGRLNSTLTSSPSSSGSGGGGFGGGSSGGGFGGGGSSAG